MADIYELSIDLNLHADLSDDELAELRWHLGLGPQPEALRLLPEFPDHDPMPLLGRHGAAWKVGGALTAGLVRQEDLTNRAWALTARQEIHPDQFDITAELLTWLATKADDRHRLADGTVHLGRTRFYEDDESEPLVLRDGEIEWP
ncbi:hypothetical protein ACQEVY_09025 [Streptomyces sp. CA-288835]|uniref:hypothetical protein n=1 Tax=Streptomyces sp. CA-288835 TaxID=3240069 RepID=UPI003D8B6FED